MARNRCREAPNLENWALPSTACLFLRNRRLPKIRKKFNSIESPRGGDTAGHPLREHLAHRCQDTEAQEFEADVPWLGKISATFRLRLAQWCRTSWWQSACHPGKAFRIHLHEPETLENAPQTLQNRGSGPPKSSFEPSKTPSLKDLYLKRVKKLLFRKVWWL